MMLETHHRAVSIGHEINVLVRVVFPIYIYIFCAVSARHLPGLLATDTAMAKNLFVTLC
jgi:hypothetical protein